MAVTERRSDATNRERFNAACEELRSRLHRVCHDWPIEEVEKLAATMTRLRFKYEPWSGMPDRT